MSTTRSTFEHELRTSFAGTTVLVAIAAVGTLAFARQPVSPHPAN